MAQTVPPQHLLTVWTESNGEDEGMARTHYQNNQMAEMTQILGFYVDWYLDLSIRGFFIQGIVVVMI